MEQTQAAALQDRLAPGATCYGCGPANPLGLRIKSRPEGGEVVARWVPGPQHQAFPGVVNGGVIATLVDCHGNWTAIHDLMARDDLEAAPATVTAELSVRYLRPTPAGGEIVLRGRVLELGADRATVEVAVEAGGRATAVGRATYVAVQPGHPAYHRWE